jgi:hypothetical protein
MRHHYLSFGLPSAIRLLLLLLPQLLGKSFLSGGDFNPLLNPLLLRVGFNYNRFFLTLSS